MGYIPVSALNVVKYSDNNEIKEVNPYYKSIQGMAVDYLTRYMTGTFKQYSVSNVSNGR
ncbi:hypothetical protein FC32_GL000492 [Ligilactobacillus apodemi DSM 16634 = JCM 16172]|uniref:Uncharacterized protein n=1 Tax=Ligilactobacillus apodemi DSM 16634 = JCM 16172 TaxID=1423724 RepID=A0A0R1U141_9LACO|nr:hypothetical protein FC32_GL000492 [Ligilactobacillus apodemi DSM 16634 = JCM 16172]